LLKEFFSSVSGSIRERASSPLLGSYTFAALLCNWKPIVILFTSEKTGTSLVSEISLALPDLMTGAIYPLIFAFAFSLLYPTVKAAIGTFNTASRIMELRSEYRLEEWKERVSLKKNDIESLIESINDLYSRDKIGYHDLKRIKDALPSPDDLKIKEG